MYGGAEQQRGHPEMGVCGFFLFVCLVFVVSPPPSFFSLLFLTAQLHAPKPLLLFYGPWTRNFVF